MGLIAAVVIFFLSMGLGSALGIMIANDILPIRSIALVYITAFIGGGASVGMMAWEIHRDS